MKRIILILGLGFFVFIAKSQTVSPELISSAGDNFSNSNYQLEWSIGEIQTETYSNTENVLTQGFHQNSYIVTTVEDLRADFKISVYPNPTADFISLNVQNLEFENMQYTITDLTGRLLQNGNITNDIEQFNFSNYAVGTYFISVQQNSQLVKTFKIIKN